MDAKPVITTTNQTFNERSLFLNREYPGILDLRVRRPQLFPRLYESKMSCCRFGNADGGSSIGRNADRKRKLTVRCFLPSRGDESFHCWDCPLGEAQSASFRTNIKGGKSAAGRLDAADIFQKNICWIGGPRMVGFCTPAKTFP